LQESNAGGIVYTAYYRRITARWQGSVNHGLVSISRSESTVKNAADLVAGNNPADRRMLPVLIRGNQSSRAVIQFKCRIGQWIGNSILAELRANGAQNYPLWFSPRNSETTNHHFVTSLDKTASTEIA